MGGTAIPVCWDSRAITGSAYPPCVTKLAALTRFRAEIERICSAPMDARTLRLQVLEELRRIIGFDAYVWLITDPDTAVGSAPLADVPCLPELPRLITLKYLSVVNRWTTLAGQDVPVALLLKATKGDRTLSLVWRELLCRYGIRDIASTVFADRFGCWGFLDLWRDAGATFDEDDATLLAAIAPPVTRALRECQARTFGAPAVSDRRELGPAVLLLDDELTIRGQTTATQSWLQVLVPAPEGHTPIPASVYNVAAQLLAVEHDVDRHRPAARVHLADGFWVTLRAARLSQPGSTEVGSIAVTIEETSPVDRLEVFSRAAALTTRETELLVHLARGSDTRDLAGRMFLSEHTVQDHLKSIFAKTSAHSRRTLLSRALGTQP